MKATLLSFLLLIAALNGAFAQHGSIGIFDESGDCWYFIEDHPRLLNIYIFHQRTVGATAVQFKVEWDPCMAMTYLSEAATPPYTQSGNSLTGTMIAYGSCIEGEKKILTLVFFASGLTPACCWMRIVADPTTSPPGIYEIDCEVPPNRLIAYGGDAVVNPDGINCFAGCYMPTAALTWGRVKALYR